MTAGPGARVAAILELLRTVADEIIVAVDDRAGEETVEAVATVADRLVRYPFADPVDRPLPWLFEAAAGDWMLTIDDDEVPSVALLDALPRLCADDRVVHYSIARRWVYPDSTTSLAEEPWRPDYQLRLFRTDPRLIRFSDRLHRPIHAEGPGRFVPEPLWHLDPVLRSREERLAKAAAYDRARPGLRAAGRALNYAFYVPELRPDAAVEPLPDVDRTLVQSILDAGLPVGVPRAQRSSVTREEIDALWPSSSALQSGEIAVATSPGSFAPNEERGVDVRIRNTGSATWDWGRDAVVAVRCASYWEPRDHRSADWTPLPAPLAPGETAIVPVHVRAPATPGPHVLRLALVQEDVGWLGGEASVAVTVREPKRVAFAGTTAAEIGAVLATDPEVDPIVVDASWLVDGRPAGRARLAARLAVRTARALIAPPRDRFGGARMLVAGDARRSHRDRALLLVAWRCGVRRR